MSGQSVCSTCAAPILWLKNDKSGKVAPINADTDPSGNCVVLGDGTYHVLTRSDPSPDPATLHTSHFQTCPRAREHSKREAALRKAALHD